MCKVKVANAVKKIGKHSALIYMHMYSTTLRSIINELQCKIMHGHALKVTKYMYSSDSAPRQFQLYSIH